MNMGNVHSFVTSSSSTRKSRLAALLSLLMLTSSFISIAKSELNDGEDPEIQLSADIQFGEVPASVNFTVSCTGDVASCSSFKLIFGDDTEPYEREFNSTTEVITIQHNYTTPGLFNANLTVSASSGEVAWAEEKLTITSDDVTFVSGHLMIPGEDPADYIVGNAYGAGTMTESGEFQVMVGKYATTLTVAFGADDNSDDGGIYAGLTIATNQSLNKLIIDHHSTAESLIFITPLMFSGRPIIDIFRLRAIQSTPEVTQLASWIGGNYGSILDIANNSDFGQLYIDTISAVQSNYNQSFVTNNTGVFLNNSNAGNNLGTLYMADEDLENSGLFGLGTPVGGTPCKFGDIPVKQHHVDSSPTVQMLCLNLPNQERAIRVETQESLALDHLVTLTQIDLGEQHELVAVDWSLQDAEIPRESIDINLFSLDDVRRQKAFTGISPFDPWSFFPYYSGEDGDDVVIDTQLAPGKSLFKWVTMGKYIDMGISELFDLSGAEEAPDSYLTLPDDVDEGVFVIRSFNGKWGAGDDNGETEFVYDNFNEEFWRALGINFISLTLEIMSIIMGGSDSKKTGMAMAECLKEPWEETIDKLKELIKDILAGTTDQAINMKRAVSILLTSTAAGAVCAIKAMGESNNNIFKKIGKFAKNVVGFIDKVGKIISATDRALSMIGAFGVGPTGGLASPLTTDLIIVGDPFSPKITKLNDVAITEIEDGKLSTMPYVEMGDTIEIIGKRFGVAGDHRLDVKLQNELGTELWFHNISTSDLTEDLQRINITLPDSGFAGRFSIAVYRMPSQGSPFHPYKTLDPNYELAVLTNARNEDLLMTIKPQIESLSHRSLHKGQMLTIEGTGFMPIKFPAGLSDQYWTIEGNSLHGSILTDMAADTRVQLQVPQVAGCGAYELALGWQDLSELKTNATFRILCSPAINLPTIPETPVPTAILIVAGLNYGEVRDDVEIIYRQNAWSYTDNSWTGGHSESTRSNVSITPIALQFIEVAPLSGFLEDQQNSSVSVKIPPIKMNQWGMTENLNYLPKGASWTTSPTATFWVKTPAGTSAPTTLNLSIDNEPEFIRYITVGPATSGPTSQTTNLSHAIEIANWEVVIDYDYNSEWNSDTESCAYDWPYAYLSPPPATTNRNNTIGPNGECEPTDGIHNWADLYNQSAPPDSAAPVAARSVHDYIMLGSHGTVEISSSQPGALRGPFVDLILGQYYEVEGGGLSISRPSDNSSNHIYVQLGNMKNNTGEVITLLGAKNVRIEGVLHGGSGCNIGLSIIDSENIRVGETIYQSENCGSHILIQNSWDVSIQANNLVNHSVVGVKIVGGGNHQIVITKLWGVQGMGGPPPAIGIELKNTPTQTPGVSDAGNRINIEDVAFHHIGILLNSDSRNNIVSAYTVRDNQIGIMFDGAHENEFSPPVLIVPPRETMMPPYYVNNSTIERNEIGVVFSGDSTANLVKKCMIRENLVGVKITTTSGVPEDNSITENWIENNTQTGLMVENSNKRNYVINNAFEHNWNDSNDTSGILVNSSSGALLILNNSFESERNGIIIEDSSNVELRRNTIESSYDEGLLIQRSFSILVADSQIVNGYDSGIHLVSSNSISMSKLVVSDNLGHGIEIEQSPVIPLGIIKIGGERTEKQGTTSENNEEWGGIIAPGVDGPNATGNTNELLIKENNGKGVYIHDSAAPIQLSLVEIILNGEEGVHIKNTSAVKITNSLIGVTSGGIISGNGVNRASSGVLIESQTKQVRIGEAGKLFSAGNVISGNSNFGVEIVDSSNTIVVSNRIGTDKLGSTAIANSEGGIRVENSDNINIGGMQKNDRNLISGHTNDNHGIWVSGDSDPVLIRGNFIGTSATGTAMLSNSIGIFAEKTADGTPSIRIEKNLISGNEKDGIMLEELDGSFIGRNIIGKTTHLATNIGAQGNSLSGIWLSKCENMKIQNNVISLNGLPSQEEPQIWLEDSSYNDIRNNRIEGGGSGIVLSSSSNGNFIVRNVIKNSNPGAGIYVLTNSVSNTISMNSITSNFGDGIVLDSGGNREVKAPVIALSNVHGDDPTRATIFGLVDYTIPEGSWVEVFADNEDEGMVYLGETQTFWMNTTLLNISDLLGVSADSLPGNLTMPGNYSHVFLIEDAKAQFPTSFKGSDLNQFEHFTATVWSTTFGDTSGFGELSSAFTFTNFTDLPPSDNAAELYILEILLPVGTSIAVDNTTFTSNHGDSIRLRVPAGVHTITLPEYITTESQEILVFSHWGDSPSSYSRTVSLNGDITLETIYEEVSLQLDYCNIEPESVSLNISENFHFTTKGWNGTQELIPEEIVWTVPNDAGTISPTGKFVALNAGTVSVQVMMVLEGRDVSCTAIVIVEEPVAEPQNTDDDDDDDGGFLPAPSLAAAVAAVAVIALRRRR